MPNINVKQEAPSTRLTPGISTFASNTSAVAPYLTAAKNYANTVVPEAQRAQTPMFLRVHFYIFLTKNLFCRLLLVCVYCHKPTKIKFWLPQEPICEQAVTRLMRMYVLFFVE